MAIKGRDDEILTLTWFPTSKSMSLSTESSMHASESEYKRDNGGFGFREICVRERSKKGELISLSFASLIFTHTRFLLGFSGWK
jgi:hypothetical protein